MPPGLMPRLTSGSEILELEGGIQRLVIPAGPSGRYRLAQLDDYADLPRRSFLWKPPYSLELEARASVAVVPGTWGFGLWNNPFGMAIWNGTEVLRLPALPNAVWFFFASPPNYLSLRDDRPAQGWTATVLRSPDWPAPLLSMGLLALPLLALRPVARWLRRSASRIVGQETALLAIDPTEWHTYRLEWQADKTVLYADGVIALETNLSPSLPLARVIWVDNQYAAFTPQGKLSYGTLPNPEPAWIEVILGK